ncbi:hypothetical protein Mapa_012784 [Marchantia paleacea]|nr:hypothetical protein Mapa_012784 [Marchantia paleacea]
MPRRVEFLSIVFLMGLENTLVLPNVEFAVTLVLIPAAVATCTTVALLPSVTRLSCKKKVSDSGNVCSKGRGDDEEIIIPTVRNHSQVNFHSESGEETMSIGGCTYLDPNGKDKQQSLTSCDSHRKLQKLYTWKFLFSFE